MAAGLSVLEDGALERLMVGRVIQQREYLMPVNCTLKMVKMVSFMLCVFYNKKH